MKYFILLFQVLVLSVACSQHQPEREALDELKKMQSYTRTGINVRDYSSRLLDVSAAVDAKLPKMRNDAAKRAIQGSLDAYIDAARYWSEVIRTRDTDWGTIIRIEQKYDLSEPISEERSENVPRLWNIATGKITEAEEALARR